MSAAVSLSETKTGIMLDGEEHYEVINGERVELPPMGAYQSTLASFLCGVLEPFTRLNHLGRVVVETLFQLTREGNLQRKPDVAFVSYQRWPLQRRVPNSNAWEVVPDLAIEINSPTNTADQNLLKTQDYFRSGVQRVWIVYPFVEQVHVYNSFTQNVILTRQDKLEETTLLPGFSLLLSEFFQNGVDEVNSPQRSQS
jgi:Uma2 family endonuclease